MPLFVEREVLNSGVDCVGADPELTDHVLQRDEVTRFVVSQLCSHIFEDTRVVLRRMAEFDFTQADHVRLQVYFP